MGYGYGYGPQWGMMGGYGGIHPFIWIIVLIAIVMLVVWLVRSQSSGMHHLPPRRSSGLDVLEERYARGDISRDEYLQKKKDIVG